MTQKVEPRDTENNYYSIVLRLNQGAVPRYIQNCHKLEMSVWPIFSVFEWECQLWLSYTFPTLKCWVCGRGD